jgi:hypothetical protein
MFSIKALRRAFAGSLALASVATFAPNVAHASCPGAVDTLLQAVDPNCNLDRLNHDTDQPFEKLIDGLVGGLLAGG